ncbi:erythrocyte membrane protein 1 [Plasmodium falciparum RAJ116]|uniref:Erythrocyte membrane protein 1 n=1 Tax=Plasmodium falciparum RAJ116 TaxID=580058 RepID=A0A0L0CVB0_PLAFA|nr:erythrocyte membrane protein 1 [Plasmodium falciparum RAJ116]
MAPGGSVGTDKSAKEVLDEFGQKVHEEIVGKKADGTGASGDAKKYIEELKGNLKEAKGIGERVAFHKTCDIINDKRDELLRDRGDPCGNTTGKEEVKRFSDKEGAQCDKKKIKDNSEGACAPFRRLHLCNKNMVKMDTNNDSKAKNDLLAEVCLAAKYEGESLKKYHDRYRINNPHSKICTELARSFADIGDIVRGRDLYLGKKKKNQNGKETEREKLEENFKKYFQQIHEDVTKGGTNGQTLKTRYNGDKNNDFFKLREDWWTANRETIWKAITCGTHDGDTYFRTTCNDNGTLSDANHKCRCRSKNAINETDQVPTYFDYVPQYLRWFEEWAEDFCRKKKKKLENLDTQCRGVYEGEKRYCSRNGFDCEKTVNARGKLRYGKQCISCLYGCNPYIDWIDNQRKQFLKQKKKYADEIKIYTNEASSSSGSRKKRAASTTKYEGYEKKFYEELNKSEYGTVDDFLEKLSNEEVCKKVKDTEGGTINFKEEHDDNNNDKKKGTFYRSEYCQPCPLCGMKKTKDGKGWEKKKEDDKCTRIKLYEPNEGAIPTDITILKSGENRDDIRKKIDDFCAKTQNGSDGSGGVSGRNSDSSLYDRWQCYKGEDVKKVKNGEEEDDEEGVDDVKKSGGLCILKKKKEESQSNSQKDPDEIQKTFHDFFYYWVAHMLKDSIHWRTKRLSKCINNGKKECIKNCNGKCDCFLKWVDQKKETEWEKIKEHFGKQGDIAEQTQTDPIVTLEGVLQIEFLNEDTEEKSEKGLDAEEAKELKHLRDIIESEENQVEAAAASDGKKKTLMDKLLDYEERIAKKCKETHTSDTCPPKPASPAGGGGVARSATSPDVQQPQPPVESEEEEEEDNNEDGDEVEEEETPKEDKDDVVQEETAKETTEDTKQGSEPPAPQEDACQIVKKLFDDKEGTGYTDWCKEKYGEKKSYPGWDCRKNTFKTGEENACMPPRRQNLYIKKLENFSGGTSPETELRKTFIECAAIETFFLWHKYKKDIENEKKKEQEGLGGLYITYDEKDVQDQLNIGTVPEEIKRQMFYTFGDYRDIFFGRDISKDATQVNQKINDVFQKDFGKPGSQDREIWWDANAKDIWEGMLCALSHASGNNDTVQTQLISNSDYTKVSFIGGFNGDTELHKFSRRPQYFRWLEEWAEEFCRKRTYKFAKIKVDCLGVNEGHKYCDGDGFECTEIGPNEDGTITTFNCPSCAISCRSFKQWINTKKNEFNKQEQKYTKEIDDPKINSNNIYDKQFVQNLRNDYRSVDLFLKNIKDGSCSNNSAKDSIIDFNNTKVTFGPAKNCTPCPVFGVNCNNVVCSEVTEKKCNGKTFKATDDIGKIEGTIKKGDMLVIDNSKKGFPKELDVCQKSSMFNGIRKDKWTCKYLCGLDVCFMENFKEGIDEKQNIQIRTLFKRWIENFLKDYNKIKENINACMNNDKGSKCINGCRENCECVEKWIDQKKEEWEKVRDLYIKQYSGNNLDEVYEVRTFLESLQPEKEVQKAKGNVEKLNDLEEPIGCTDTDTLQNGECKKKDVIESLLNKLKKEIEPCKNQPHKTQPHCVPFPKPSNHPSNHDNPEEDPDTSTTSSRPDFCPKEPQPPAPTMPEEDTTDGDAGIDENVPVPAPAGDQKEEKVPADEAPKLPKKPEKKTPTKPRPMDYRLTDVLLPSAFPLSVGIAFAALSYFLLKKKTKSTIDLLRVINIPKGDYGIPTMKSKNRYIPYVSDRYKGKTYIYMEGDTDEDKYTFMSDTSDITSSSESEYEEIDINDIYPYQSPKYKTLIEVVLEPSKRDIQSDDIPSSDTPMNKFTDDEWNQLKHDFISNMLQSEPNDVPNDYRSGNVTLNTQPNTLYFDKPQEKPFITSIHDRNLYSGEEYDYNVNMVNNDDIPINRDNNPYSGIDLINDSLNSNQHIDIYDEVLKRKENELFGTYHTKKNTSTNSVAKNTNSDPIHNQIKLFHKWLDRHRHMCDQWDKNKKEELLDKLKEEWNKENNNNSGKTYNSDNKPSHNHVLNTDVSIQIDMDNPKTKNEFTNTDTYPEKSTMDTIIDDLEKYNEPYYYDFYEDDIYYDVNDDKASVDNINMDHNKMDNNNSDVPTKVQIEMNVINNQELLQNEYPISDM